MKLQYVGAEFYGSQLEIVYDCPNTNCRELFIAYFRRVAPITSPNQFRYDRCRPTEAKPVTFNKIISEISNSFCEIYAEAHKAEELSLTRICGVGYRKALEFLLKDYLITLNPEKKDDIEKTLLGKCIDLYVTDGRVKDVAKRAVWLGNDETHYQRRWIDKDLKDLKALIQLVNHWIEAEHLTRETLKSMPG